MKRFLLLGLLFVCLETWAQDNTVQMALQKAAGEYAVGRWEQVKQLLDNIEQWPTAERCQGYRLLALTALANDCEQECRERIRAMLKAEPYYTAALQDPLRFVEMVKKLQNGEVILVTASQQAESVDEAPVPVTLITAQMLEDIGARTLKDALVAYVPGMTSVESANELNVAMRGIYSSGQQKILLMIDGHRLNSRSTNGANPDYSISLEKVRQIEVLRGPASSLYGNVALTAVVNMITKNGQEADGVCLSGGIGNFGQREIGILLGKRFMDMNFTAWGKMYYARGQSLSVPAAKAVTVDTVRAETGQAVIGGYRDLPSYDVGLTYRWNGFSAFCNLRYCKMVNPLADVSSPGATYTYNKYYKMGGEGVGTGFHNAHSEIKWQDEFQNWNIEALAYFDRNTTNQYSVPGDATVGRFKDLNGNWIVSRYAFQIANWRERAIGGMVKLGRVYTLGKSGNGNLLVGLQTEHINVYDAYGIVGKDYVVPFYFQAPLQTGIENLHSFFFQVRHHLKSHFIFNMGLRGDYKVRADSRKIFACSPRLSVIYVPDGSHSWKFSYARSFVDAPYFYRCNVMPSFKGSNLLSPEYLSAIQLSFGWHPEGTGLRYDGNLFYTRLTDFIFRDAGATGDMPKYKNAGRLDLMGVENTLAYSSENFRGTLNASAQWVIDGANFDFRGRRIYNIPPVSMTWVTAVRLTGKRKHEWWLRADGNIRSVQLSPIENVYIDGQLTNIPNNHLPAICLLNGGIEYRWACLHVSLQVYNLANTTYYEGGSTVVPYRQQGSSVMVKLAYSLKK